MTHQPSTTPVCKATPIRRPVFNVLLSPWSHYFFPNFTKPFSSYTSGNASRYTTLPVPRNILPASNGNGSGSSSSSPSASDYNSDTGTSLDGKTEYKTDILIYDKSKGSASSGPAGKMNNTSKTGVMVAPKTILKKRNAVGRNVSRTVTKTRVRFNIKNERAPRIVRGI